MSSRGFQFTRRIAISTVLKYIPSRLLNQRGLRLCFRPFGGCRRRKSEIRPASMKGMWSFFHGFFALPK